MSNSDSQNPKTRLGAAPASSPSCATVPAKLAPIALFVYNRPEHTRRTVEALRANDLAQKSDLYVFAEAAKDESAAAGVVAVRKFIRSIDGFKSVTIVERDRNLGLAASVIRGVTQVCDEFGRVITVEDDLLTTADFLTFMNQALHRFADEPKLFSVSGFNFALHAPQHYPYDAFCFYRSSSLGWGTWKDRWQKVDWLVSGYNDFSTDKNQRRQFNRGGEDLSDMLAFQMAGRIDSWAIRWAYAHYKQDALSLLSLRPRVFHIGSDGSGTHTRRGALRQLPLTSDHKSDFHFPPVIETDPHLVSELQRLLRPSIARRLVRYLRRFRTATLRIDSSALAETNVEQVRANPGSGVNL